MPKGVAPPRNAFGELTSCQSWPEALRMLKEDAPLRDVAEFMQAQGDMLDIKAESLRRHLARYKKRILTPKIMKTFIDRVLGDVPLDLDDVEELTKVVLIQKRRVSKFIELEEHMKMPMSTVGKEVVMLFDLIERRLKALQELGQKPRVPQDHRVLSVGDPTLTKLLDMISPEARERIRGAIAASASPFIEGEVREVSRSERENGVSSTDPTDV